MMRSLIAAAGLCVVGAAPTKGTFTEVSSFSIPKSPSGMYFYPTQGLLYILCGTATNGDHFLYAYDTSGNEKCAITIPYEDPTKMARVDGFWITDDGTKAYIVDSQGPMHSQSAGGSMYEVPWTNPCGCDADGKCSSTTATWKPTISKQWVLTGNQADVSDGGGNDDYFRNSGVVISGDSFYAVNGVHPNPSLTCCYPKSLVKVSMADSKVTNKWSFTASTIGHDVDMEGLTCGSDGCENYIYMGDEYNYIYKLNLATSDPAAAVEVEWDVNSAVGDVKADKGIESLTYAKTTGHFYAGIQDTAKIHVFALTDPTASSSTDDSTTAAAGDSTATTAAAGDSTATTAAADDSTTSTTTASVNTISGSVSAAATLAAVVTVAAAL